MDADSVVRYLRRHPDFLLDHPDLVETLTPPTRHAGDTVTDLGNFMARRLQEEVKRLNRRERELLAGTRNLRLQNEQTHQAALAMLEARGFEHLIHIVTRDMTDQLRVDAISICIEAADEDSPRPPRASGVYVLEPGTVDSLIRDGCVFIGESCQDLTTIFGPAARLVRSLALVRLAVSSRTPCGLLALGSRDEHRFEKDQCSDHLRYLGRHLERLLRAWLDLPV
jgi:uncharacterized protein YigA (DUF484 family)